MSDQPSFNAVVGQNVQRLRKLTANSQEGLARDLAARGLSLQQQTILKIEKGQRPLRLDEAVVFADALRVTVADLLPPTESTQHELERSKAEWRSMQAAIAAAQARDALAKAEKEEERTRARWLELREVAFEEMEHQLFPDRSDDDG